MSFLSRPSLPCSPRPLRSLKIGFRALIQASSLFRMQVHIHGHWTCSDQMSGVVAVANARPETGDLVYGDLVSTKPTKAVDNAFKAIDPDAIARLMFTSGSSGSPKAVIQTQRNIMVAVESQPYYLRIQGKDPGSHPPRLDAMEPCDRKCSACDNAVQRGNILYR